MVQLDNRRQPPRDVLHQGAPQRLVGLQADRRSPLRGNLLVGCEAREAEVMDMAELQRSPPVTAALKAAVEEYGAAATAKILRALADEIEKPERLN